MKRNLAAAVLVGALLGFAGGYSIRNRDAACARDIALVERNLNLCLDVITGAVPQGENGK